MVECCSRPNLFLSDLQHFSTFYVRIRANRFTETRFDRQIASDRPVLELQNEPRKIGPLAAPNPGRTGQSDLSVTTLVNGVRFVVHSRDLNRTTQNSGVSTIDADGRPYYGVLEEILELRYLGGRKVVLFRCKWFKTDKQGCLTKDNITSICTRYEWFKEDQYLLATQANQVFYLDDPVKRRGESGKYWKVVQEVHHRKIWDRDINAGDIEVDLLHGRNSSDISLSSNLDDFTPMGLSRGEAIELEHNPALDHDDTDDNIDDDMDDDTDNERESQVDTCDESN